MIHFIMKIQEIFIVIIFVIIIMIMVINLNIWTIGVVLNERVRQYLAPYW